MVPRLSVLLALIVILAGLVWGVWLLLPQPPGDDSAEAGFARDMSVHHAQAVEMALILRDRTDDETLRFMATDIILTQQAQIGEMQGWLNIWGLPATGTEPPMAWMGHPVEGRMPGMASPEQIEQLREAPVDEAEAEFLELMIAHHVAGVEMAEAVLDQTDQPVVRRLADAIVAGQQVEIDAMQEMLAERGVPVAADSVGAHGMHMHDLGEADRGAGAESIGSLASALPLVAAVAAAAWLVFDGLRGSRSFALSDDT